ncbi:phosphoribosyltransferase [Nitrosopumilus cobalaminigenes]|uniref:Phosphoribosyltransferase n=1 Tax=Nitrosopumilus cobalaminigenes TaxID=1470066 RepID=A0A7D5QXA3_9ARCH|nr:phosphoribosyltransferase [Nitrosopumilus cobalaminigenes]QLH02696.1 phosphoribosyltransferase [Nitrosopumilus cobalaminigenes]
MALEQYVEWSEIDSIIGRLSDVISNSSRKFSSISTLSRGGLVPSRLLADHLGIKKILVDEERISYNSLFVDDIFDSGKTFERVISQVDNSSKLFYITLFARRGKTHPSQLIYGKETDNDAYVVFPWDKLEFERSKK